METVVAPRSETPPASNVALAAAIERLEARLARMEEAMGRITRLLDQATPALATLTDSADDWIARAQARGEDLDARLQAALHAAERLTAPETVARLDRLLQAAEEMPGFLAMGGDILDGWVAKMQEAGIDLDERGRILLHAVERLTSPQALEVLQALLSHVDVVQGLLDAGVFDPEPVSIVSKAGQGLAQVGRERPGPVGPFALLSALRDPDVQRSIGFALHFARRFGQALDHNDAQRLPAAR